MMVINMGEKCEICSGSCKNFLNPCYCWFCASTGLSTKYGAAFMKYHLCYCALNDNKICPICLNECHHKPKLLIEKR